MKGKRWAGNYLLTATSSDGGKTWSQPTFVHSDRTDGEHSFASLAMRDDDHATIVWLDARDYETKHTYRLMSAVIASSGTVSDEQTVDNDVCTCCPTSLVKTSTGFVAAYRNHTSEEIRDIYTVREQAGEWQTGTSLHNDGWHIQGCPVNGAALAQRQDEIAIAWYTGLEEKASLQVGFSNDGGATFPVIRKIDADRGASLAADWAARHCIPGAGGRTAHMAHAGKWNVTSGCCGGALARFRTPSDRNCARNDGWPGLSAHAVEWPGGHGVVGWSGGDQTRENGTASHKMRS